MTLIEQIQKDREQALKAGNKAAATTLVNLLSDIKAEGKKSNREATEAEAVTVIKRAIGKVKETQGFAVGQWPAEKLAELDTEIALLSLYLPVQLTQADLEALIYIRVNKGLKTKGELMKSLKEGYNGRYDGKLASSLIDRILSE